MGSDFYNDDSSDNSYRRTVALCVAAASLVVLLFLVFLYLNQEDEKKNKVSDAAKLTTEEKVQDIMADAHNFTSDELEFWDEVPKENETDLSDEDEEEGQLTPYNDGSDADSEDLEDFDKDLNKKKSSKDKYGDDADDIADTGEGSLNKNIEEDEEKIGDDEHLAVVGDDGKKRYYEILKDVKKNDYDFDNCLTNMDGQVSYKDSKREAVVGVDLSKYNGNVDFSKLKAAGVKFAMLRLGSRGYGSGVITLDDKFVEYAQNAALNGIAIGAYFYSAAINETEAIEEANYIVGAVSGFNVKYPIAIDVEKVSGDTSRTENLTTAQRTAVVKKFCDTVKGFGYNPIIYASRDMLIADLDLNELADYDVWLSDENIPTDYPYRFSLWQYTKKGSVQGVDGNVDLDLSFVRFEEK